MKDLVNRQAKLLKDIVEPAGGDHPALLLGSRGELVSIIGIGTGEFQLLVKPELFPEFFVKLEEVQLL